MLTTKQLLLVFGILFLYLPFFAQLSINEVVSDNDNTIADNFGEYDDWIEIYNSGNTPINLANYYISDNPSDPLKFKFPATNASLTTVPANGFLILWADNDETQGEHHLNFKLSSGGESIVLTDMDGLTQIDQLDYTAIEIDESFGRKPNGASTTFVFTSSTPAASNNSAAQKATPVVISPQGGIKSGAQTITLTTSLPGANIYYTTDGSVPTSSSTFYNGPFTVNSNSSIRAVTIKSGYQNSYPTTESYVFNYTTDLPVIFITLPPRHFSSDQDGFYVLGTNGIVHSCTGYPANFNQPWEKEINLTMYETDGTQVINQTAGVKIAGNCTREYPVRSMNIKSKDEYGYSHFEHKLFPEYEQDKFKRFKLRTGGNDAQFCAIRDVVGQKIVERQIDLDHQRSRPAAVFINSEYWGYYYIREWISEHYVDEKHKIEDKDNLDIVAGNTQIPKAVYTGSATHYTNMWNYFNGQTSISNAEYQYIKDVYLDTDEYMNYQMTQIFIANSDWPTSNQRQWRERNGGVFRYVLYDTDYGYARNIGNSSSRQYSDWDQEGMKHTTNATVPGWPNPPASTMVFRKMLTNNEFKNEFIQSFGTLLSTVFPYSRTGPIFQGEIAKIVTERPKYYTRWDGAWHPDGYTWHVNPALTQTHYNRIDNFLDKRPAFLYEHLKDFFNISGTYNLTIPLSSNDNGRVVLNSNEYLAPYNYTGRYFDGIPVTFKAIPNPGYRFSHWQETGQTTATITLTVTTDRTRTPIFVPTADIVINEIHYNPSDVINEKEFIEIHNPGTAARDLSGYEFSSGVCFAFPEGTIIQPNSYIVIAKDQSQFSGTVFQWDDSNLSNSSEKIVLQNSIGRTIDSVDYSDNFPWPLLPDGFGNSLELNYPVPSSNHTPYTWHASAAINGSPGAQNSMLCDTTTVPPPPPVTTVPNTHLQFDGTNDYISLNNMDVSSSALTLEALINSSNFSNCSNDQCRIISKALSPTPADHYWMLSTDVSGGNTVLRFRVKTNGITTSLTATTGIMSENTWYHVAATYDGNAMRLFLNGSQVASTPKTGSLTTNPAAAAWIGGNPPTNTGHPWDGKIDEVRIWNIARTQAQLQANSGEELTGTESGLQAYYRFNEGSGQTINDAAGNNNTVLGSTNNSDTNDPTFINLKNPNPNPYNDVVINEINYNSNDQNNPGDWIELYNTTNANIDLSGWKFYDSENVYAIPSNTMLPKNGFLVLAQDINLFTSIFPHLQQGTNVVGGFNFALNSGGERIALFDNSTCPVDELRYNDNTPWDSIPDGNGPTLSLITPTTDNSIPGSWEGSNNINAPLGTPGRANEQCPTFSITTPDTICSGDQILLYTTSNDNASFNWTIQGGTPTSAIGDSIDVTFSSPGLAFATLNSNYFECSASTQSLLNVQSCILDCITFEISMILEGAYNAQTGLMETTLNTSRAILPGMSSNPVAGQPYSIAPWNYPGNEGMSWTDSDYSSSMVDWVLISFRTNTTKSSELARVAGILHSDGTVEFPESCIEVSDLPGSFYIVAEHRNHMAAMSPVKVSVINRTLTWDFRTSNSYAASGNGSKEINTGVWGLYAGDCNQVADPVSYDINGQDKANWLLDNGTFGVYILSDMDMDGDVSGSDKLLWTINNGIFGSVTK